GARVHSVRHRQHLRRRHRLPRRRHVSHRHGPALGPGDYSMIALRGSMIALRGSMILREARGFSLTELLVSCGVLGIVLAALGSVLTTGTQVSQDGNSRHEAQQAARAGLIMEEDLKLAGSGFPPSGIKITAATPTSVSFWADIRGASTTLTA